MHVVRFAISTLIIAAVPILADAQGTSPCFPSDAHAQNLVNYVKYLITSTDPGIPALKQGLGLGSVTVSQVTLITTGTDCTKARAAVDALANSPNSGRRFYLVKAGTKRFFVRDPNATAGEYTPALVFDNKWVFVQSLLG